MKLRRSKATKFAAFILAMFLLATFVAGCGSSTPAPAGSTASPASSAPAESSAASTQSQVDNVVIWTTASSETVKNWDEDVILQAVEKATNTHITVTPVDNNTLIDQLNAAIAGNTLPDILPIVGPENRGMLEKWINDGVLAAYEGDVAKAAPNVLKEYEDNPMLAELKVNGKIYFQPGFWGFKVYPNGGLIHVRKDLLDKYGMTPPETFKDYFAYLKASKDAGDGSGVTFSGASGVQNALSAFVGAYGLPMNGWVKKDSGYEYWAIQPDVKNGLLLFRQMVSEGLIDPASWEMNDDQNRSAFVSGKSTSMIFWGGGHIGRIQNDMALVNANFKEWLLPALDAGTGKRGYTSEGMYWGTGQIGGMKNNNPVAAARVINYLISDEGVKLTAIGIEGRDYEMVNGEPKILEQRTKDGFPTEAGATGAHPLATNLVSWVPQELQNWQLLYGKDEAYKSWFNSMWENQGKYQIPSYGQAISANSWASFQSTSNELVTRYFTEIVKSKSDGEASKKFDEFVNAWLTSGGTAAQADMSSLLATTYK